MSFKSLMRSIVFGNPPEANHEPSKDLMVEFGTALDTEFATVDTKIAAVTANQIAGYVGFETQALLFAELDYDANTVAVVFEDADPAKNGKYLKVGASGTGSWNQTTTLAGIDDAVQAIIARSDVLGARRAGRNIFKRQGSEINKILDGATGTTWSVAGNFVTAFLSVVPGETYYANHDLYAFAWYDAFGVHISGEDSFTATPVRAVGAGFTAPAGAYLMRTYNALAFYGTLTIGVESLLTAFKPFGVDDNNWIDRLVCFLGDSQVEAGIFQPMVRDLVGLAWHEFTNDGLGGRKMAGLEPVITAANLAPSEMAIIYIGINDFLEGAATTLGIYSDTSASATFYGHTRKVCEKLMSENAALHVGFITPIKNGDVGGSFDWRTPNEHGAVLADYVQAIKEVCADFGFPVLDLFSESGITDANFSIFLGDNLHLNTAGWARVAPKIASWIKSI